MALARTWVTPASLRSFCSTEDAQSVHVKPVTAKAKVTTTGSSNRLDEEGDD
jgi:hypothetical protein